MDFKKKAGLALALAAIFSVGGTGAALAADNSTTSSPSGGDSVTITGGDEGAPGGILQVGTPTDPIVPTNGVINIDGDMADFQETIYINSDGKVDEIILTAGATLKLTGSGSGKVIGGNNTGTILAITDGTAVYFGNTAAQWAAIQQGGELPELQIGNVVGAEATTITIEAAEYTGTTLFLQTGVTHTANDTLTLTIQNGGILKLDSVDMVDHAGTGHTEDAIATIIVNSTGANMVSGWYVTGDVDLGIEANSIEFQNDFGLNEVRATHLLAGEKFQGNFAMSENQAITLGSTDMTLVENTLAHLENGSYVSAYTPFGRFGEAQGMYHGIFGVYAGQTIITNTSYNVDVTLDGATIAPAASGAVAFSDNSIFAVDAQMGRKTNDRNDVIDPVFTVDIDSGGALDIPAGGAFTIGGSATDYYDDTNVAPAGRHHASATFYAQNAAAGRTLTVAENLQDASGIVVKLGDLVDDGKLKGSFNTTGGLEDLSALTQGQATEFLDNALSNTGNWHYNSGTLVFSSDLLRGKFDLVLGAGTNDSSLVLRVERNDVEVQDVYPYLSNGMANMVDELYGDNRGGLGENNVNSDNAGIAFVSRATDNTFMRNHTEAAQVLESAAQIAVAAGVPAVTNSVITKVADLIVDHNNILNDTQPAYGNEPGAFGLWVTPFYGVSEADGLDSGRFDGGYDMNYGGAAMGFDYNLNEAFRVGLALNVGGGDSDSKGDFSDTTADFDFFGVGLYGSYSNGAFGLTGDFGYTSVSSDIEQDIPAGLAMGNQLKSSVDSDAFTLGLTGQYRFTVGDGFGITPHLGVRYTNISTDDAEVKAGGSRVFNVNTEDQDLFQIPLGVEFSKAISTDSGWTITPSADLGVLFTAGDTDVESRATIWNTGFTGRSSTDVNDTVAFQGAVGVKAAADNGLSLGLDYGILASGNQTDHQFSGMLRFEF